VETAGASICKYRYFQNMCRLALLYLSCGRTETSVVLFLRQWLRTQCKYFQVMRSSEAALALFSRLVNCNWLGFGQYAAQFEDTATSRSAPSGGSLRYVPSTRNKLPISSPLLGRVNRMPYRSREGLTALQGLARPILELRQRCRLQRGQFANTRQTRESRNSQH
jgi:hypothetical protein